MAEFVEANRGTLTAIGLFTALGVYAPTAANGWVSIAALGAALLLLLELMRNALGGYLAQPLGPALVGHSVLLMCLAVIVLGLGWSTFERYPHEASRVAVSGGILLLLVRIVEHGEERYPAFQYKGEWWNWNATCEWLNRHVASRFIRNQARAKYFVRRWYLNFVWGVAVVFLLLVAPELVGAIELFVRYLRSSPGP